MIVRPFVEREQRRYLPRVLAMLALRALLGGFLAWWAPGAALLYLLAYALLLTGLNFLDAFHHTFEQFFVGERGIVPMNDRDRDYERSHTYSNVLSTRHAWLNVLILNFGFHNAHHERASAQLENGAVGQGNRVIKTRREHGRDWGLGIRDWEELS